MLIYFLERYRTINTPQERLKHEKGVWSRKVLKLCPYLRIKGDRMIGTVGRCQREHINASNVSIVQSFECIVN